jgi:hypothetical protein
MRRQVEVPGPPAASIYRFSRIRPRRNFRTQRGFRSLQVRRGTKPTGGETGRAARGNANKKLPSGARAETVTGSPGTPAKAGKSLQRRSDAAVDGRPSRDGKRTETGVRVAMAGEGTAPDRGSPQSRKSRSRMIRDWTRLT